MSEPITLAMLDELEMVLSLAPVRQRWVIHPRFVNLFLWWESEWYR